jgi:hypothetical protein
MISGFCRWRATRRLPVDVRQQAAGAVAAAYRQHDAVSAFEGSQLVDIVQALMLSSGKPLLAAGMTSWCRT